MSLSKSSRQQKRSDLPLVHSPGERTSEQLSFFSPAFLSAFRVCFCSFLMETFTGFYDEVEERLASSSISREFSYFSKRNLQLSEVRRRAEFCGTATWLARDASDLKRTAMGGDACPHLLKKKTTDDTLVRCFLFDILPWFHSCRGLSSEDSSFPVELGERERTESIRVPCMPSVWKGREGGTRDVAAGHTFRLPTHVNGSTHVPHVYIYIYMLTYMRRTWVHVYVPVCLVHV